MDPERDAYADPPTRWPRCVRLFFVLLLCMALVGGVRVGMDVMGPPAPPGDPPPEDIPIKSRANP